MTLTTNMTMNNNVFLAAWKLGLTRVVYASSETTLGLPFDEVGYVPSMRGTTRSPTPPTP
ncbi:hypothetical protein G7085_16005 [Tessaracoccus sp. HDW20]|uniref:hypothetical protein n=1 Tax=Tessaracoccus coleopterorum TaxID=2714950 RepID=UPI0018D33936|nr:hypothetical protein [Tessaracoccus coleopterorum]NHB85593.1 hypothetical protein [Tessaracoccus coleopterorum]